VPAAVSLKILFLKHATVSKDGKAKNKRRVRRPANMHFEAFGETKANKK
jgi:hypothetical protein